MYWESYGRYVVGPDGERVYGVWVLNAEVRDKAPLVVRWKEGGRLTRRRWKTVGWLALASLVAGGAGLYLARPDAPAVRHARDRDERAGAEA